jgi:CheY-like chemotaxis protein
MILVCDDEPSLRELVRAVLGPTYSFVEADDGPRALALARELHPDLIVLDLMLPGMSGIEVLDVIRGDSDLAPIPVIVVTAWSHAEVSARVAGADRFVPKPFDPQELEAAVEELLA